MLAVLWHSKWGTVHGELYTVRLSNPLLQNRWFLVSAQYDAEEGRLVVSAEPVKCVAAREFSWKAETVDIVIPLDIVVPQQGALRFGAASRELAQDSGNLRRLPLVDALNGKLDSVRLTCGALSHREIKAISRSKIPHDMARKVVGCWDFSKGIGTTAVHDLSGNNLNGTAINMPDRAVIGVHWDRSMGSDWQHARVGYSACYFHDDDLYDCEWTSDFSYAIPSDLPSGVYAVRLQHGDFEGYIPFFVAPEKNKPTAKAAMLMSTTIYTAYTNYDGVHGLTRLREIKTENGSAELINEKMFPNLETIVEEGKFMVVIRNLPRVSH